MCNSKLSRDMIPLCLFSILFKQKCSIFPLIFEFFLLQLDTDSQLLSVNGVKPITPEQEELIHRLVYFQNEYEHPSPEDIKRIVVSINKMNISPVRIMNTIYQ